MVPFVDWAAHLGGLIGGLLMGGALFGRSLEPAWQGKLCQCTSILVLLAGIGTGLWIVYDVIEPDEKLLHICAYYEAAYGSHAAC